MNIAKSYENKFLRNFQKKFFYFTYYENKNLERRINRKIVANYWK